MLRNRRIALSPLVAASAIALTQTSNQEFLRDFENMVLQSVVGGGERRRAGTN